MRQSTVFLLAALIALPAGSQIGVAADAETTFVPAQTTTEYLAKDHLIGAKVTGKDGKIIGDVEDLIIDDHNQVVGVVMGTGGYFGIAEKKVAVDLASLKFEEKDGKISVALPDVTAETLKTAPAFERAKPPKSLFERAKEKVQELSDKTKSSTSDAIEDAKPMLEDAQKKATEAYEKAKEAAAPVIEKAKEAVSGAVGTAKDDTSVPATTEGTASPAAEAPTPEAPATEAPAADTPPAPTLAP